MQEDVGDALSQVTPYKGAFLDTSQVTIVGLNCQPNAGDLAYVVEDPLWMFVYFDYGAGTIPPEYLQGCPILWRLEKRPTMKFSRGYFDYGARTIPPEYQQGWC